MLFFVEQSCSYVPPGIYNMHLWRSFWAEKYFSLSEISLSHFSCYWCWILLFTFDCQYLFLVNINIGKIIRLVFWKTITVIIFKCFKNWKNKAVTQEIFLCLSMFLISTRLEFHIQGLINSLEHLGFFCYTVIIDSTDKK